MASVESIEIRGYCTLCRSRCGTINTVQDGRLVSVRADHAHPTGSAMCVKGRAAPELVYSPHRIKYPMRRTNPKGDSDPGWVRISWEEALSEVANKLDRIRREDGPEAVVFAVTTPSGTPLSDSIDWIERFVRYYGSPNICYATEICNWHKDFAHAFTFGCGMPSPDVEHADLVMLWGHNPTSTWLAQADAGGRGRAKGAKLLVVDPRPTALARQADVWLDVRPGTDAALALGLIHLLIEADAFDASFIRKWTNGPVLVREDNGAFLCEQDLDAGAAANRVLVWNGHAQSVSPLGPLSPSLLVDPSAEGVLRGEFLVDTLQGTVRCHPAFELLTREVARYTPEYVSEISGVASDAIRDAARLIASSKRVAYHAWSGVGQHTNATQTERAIAVLYALTGSFDQIGGNRVYPKHTINPISELSQLPASQLKKALGIAERPIGPPSQGWVTARDTYHAILTGTPYKLRAMFGFGTNVLSSQADAGLGEDALRALEFHVHCDLFETPTASFADILLPVGTPWEREGLRVGFDLNAVSQERIQLRPRMVAPQGEARSDNEIVFDLAQRLGLKDAFFEGSLEAGWNHMLAPTGVTVAQLRECPGGIDIPLRQRERLYETKGFDTETKRVELYSALLQRHGQPALPTFVPIAENRAGRVDRYPLILSSAKNGYFCHSQHRSIVSLRKRALRPIAEMAAETARKRGIEDGDPIVVRTRNGQARFIAQVKEDMQADLIVGEFGWWQSCPEIGARGYPLQGPENSHYNGLISSEHADPVSGSVPLRSFRCDVVRDPEFDMARRHWKGWRKFTVAEVEPLAEGVIGLHFRPIDGGELPDFLPGQHVSVRVETSLDLSDSRVSQPLVRAYSLTGSGVLASRRFYSIAVRHQRGANWSGAMSGHLHTRIEVGREVELQAPSGRFTLPIESVQPVVLIAGGIGVTPFVSQLETLASLEGSTQAPQITLHYANRNGAAHAFRGRLEALAKRLPSLRIIDHYNVLAPGDQCDRVGRIDDQVVSDAQIAARARIYMCGPLPMMEAVRTGLVARGVPNFDIFHEQFTSPVTPAEGSASYAVTFRRSALVAQWEPQSGTLLEFAEKLGVPLPNGCRVGQCESCAVNLVGGNAMHLHGVAPDDPSIILACQAIPVSDLTIDA